MLLLVFTTVKYTMLMTNKLKVTLWNQEKWCGGCNNDFMWLFPTVSNYPDNSEDLMQPFPCPSGKNILKAFKNKKPNWKSVFRLPLHCASCEEGRRLANSPFNSSPFCTQIVSRSVVSKLWEQNSVCLPQTCHCICKLTSIPLSDVFLSFLDSKFFRKKFFAWQVSTYQKHRLTEVIRN